MVSHLGLQFLQITLLWNATGHKLKPFLSAFLDILQRFALIVFLLSCGRQRLASRPYDALGWPVIVEFPGHAPCLNVVEWIILVSSPNPRYILLQIRYNSMGPDERNLFSGIL